MTESTNDNAVPRVSAGRKTGFLGRLLRHRSALFAVIVLTLLVGLSAFAPFIAGTDPTRINPANRLLPPSAEYPFGTDHLGRDLFKTTLYGGRTSLFVGFAVTAISMGVAILLGLISGFFRTVDLVLMRLVDGMLAFPAIVLATAVAGIFGPSVSTVVISLTIVLIAPSVRIVRGQVLVARELPMIEAARAVGVPGPRILRRYILPTVMSPILVQASFIFSAAVLGEAALSFIGLGLGSRSLSWGGTLSEARIYIQKAPWMVMFPGAALMLTILSLNLLGDSLRDLLDPKLARSR